MVDFIICYRLDLKQSNILDLFQTTPSSLKKIITGGYELLLWGDPIIRESGLDELQKKETVSCKQLLENISGHFYYLLYSKIEKKISIGSSLFSILPVYYTSENGKVFLSNSTLAIAQKLTTVSVSKRFVLENILFNYPLFNHTCFNEIKLLDANHTIQLIENSYRIEKVLAIEDYFVKHPTPWKSEVDRISNLFIKQVEKYFPNEPYLVSLTGGFDGRTLVAASLYYKKKFSTFSFGNPSTKDVKIPEQLAASAGLGYRRIDLGKDYQLEHSLKNGLEFVEGACGAAGFSRAHYLYAVKNLSEKSRHMVTGNFGSEIFRASHIAGAVISPNLYRLFHAENFETAIQDVQNSPEWGAINRSEFLAEWEVLKEDLKELPCFNKNYAHFSKNMQFYCVVFNEVFRKYFGAEIVNQFKYLVNRTPFLDFEFVKEILKTELCGVYSDFFTHNPLKRFKGQVTYSHIIQKTYVDFGNQLTDKGYAPKSLLSLTGKLGILISFIKKRIKKESQEEADGYSVSASYRQNKEYFEKELTNHRFFNRDYFEQGVQKAPSGKNSYFIALSQKWWVQHLEKNYVTK